MVRRTGPSHWLPLLIPSFSGKWYMHSAAMSDVASLLRGPAYFRIHLLQIYSVDNMCMGLLAALPTTAITTNWTKWVRLHPLGRPS